MLRLRARWFYLCIVGASLCMGYVLYFVGRPGSPIFALPANLDSWNSVHTLVAEFSGQLPSFLHTYAFILLTFLVLGTSSRFNLHLSIALWSIVEILFETGQHILFKSSFIDMIPAWFELVPVLNSTTHYFLYGTFDPLDLLAIAIASVFALLTVRMVQVKEFYHE